MHEGAARLHGITVRFAGAQEKAGSLFDHGYRCMVHLLSAASNSGRSLSAWAASA